MQTDYALRLLMFLTVNPARLSTISEVAEHYAVSRNHLMKVANALSGLGFVDSTRGRGGGMSLAMNASQIVIGDVVRAMENDFELVECLGDDNQCVIAQGCRLAKVLVDANNAFLAVLDEVSLADLSSRNRTLRSLLKVAS